MKPIEVDSLAKLIEVLKEAGNWEDESSPIASPGFLSEITITTGNIPRIVKEFRLLERLLKQHNQRKGMSDEFGPRDDSDIYELIEKTKDQADEKKQ